MGSTWLENVYPTVIGVHRVQFLDVGQVVPEELGDLRFPLFLLIGGRPFVVGVGEGLVHDVPHEKAGLVLNRLDDSFT